MEIENMMNNHQNMRKRARDQGEVECRKEYSHRKGKKPAEFTSFTDDSSYQFEKGFEKLHERTGVFDFPWLKEGVIFRADEYMEPQEEYYAFGTCSFQLDDAPGCFLASLDHQAHVQNVPPPPAVDRKSWKADDHDDGDESSWSFLVDDLEPVDCIWRCVIDQPLDIGLNKAYIATHN